MDPAIEEADQEVQQEEVEQTDGEAERGSDSGEKAGQIFSKCDKCKLTFGGHIFWRQKNSKDGSKTFWECIHRYDGCKKRLHTLAGTLDVVKEIGEHKHRVDPI
uniref:FLYWCH-type domain-containing protein n=1 Tax=Ditylenchus dipsaci TaxID=166011 RepID=A0A915D6T1_9BILA